MFAGTTRHVSSGATPEKRSNGNKTSLCSHDKPACEPGARCSVSILILVLEKKEQTEYTGAAVKLRHTPVQAR